MIRLLLPLLLIGGAIAAVSYFRKATAGQRAKALRGLYGVAAFIGVMLVLRLMRMHPAALVGAALVFALRYGWKALPWLRGESTEGDSRSAAGGGHKGMSREQALDVLGLEQGATREQILHKHRQLIRDLHPDKGGSTFLTQQINQARDVLID